jgi:hypothetical protein
MQSTSAAGLSWEVDNALRSEVWLAHESLKPMCDALSAHLVCICLWKMIILC